IIKSLFNLVVLVFGIALLAEYFQIIDLHPSFPPSEKGQLDKDLTEESNNKTVIEEIPNIESDDITVRDVPDSEKKEENKEEMFEEMPENIAVDVADVEEEDLARNEGTNTDGEENGVKTIAVEAKKITLPKVMPTYAKDDVLPFGVRFNGNDSYFNVFGVYLLPEETFSFEVITGKQFSNIKVVASKGKLAANGKHDWKWTAPKTAGLYSIVLTPIGSSETMKLNCFVMIPIPKGKENVVLKDFKIGKYPLAKREEYATPKGFIEVNKSNEKAHVSPNFQLSEFLSNQSEKWKYPNYLYLDEQLLVKLELLLAAVNNSGIKCDKFAVLSGYRTPHYNQLKDNKEYSRHQFGKATDIYIDNDKDGWMDDLNGDGKRNTEDGKVLYDLIDSFQKQAWYKPFIGGMGFYEQNSSRTSFVHVDVRAQKIPIRW
ncbi:MAG: hypothetical protein ACPGVB_17225, partial [Chitinophagales bacterium]